MKDRLWFETTKRQARTERRVWLRPENRKQAAETFERIATMIARPAKGRRAWPKDATGEILDLHIQLLLNFFDTEQGKPILDAYRGPERKPAARETGTPTPPRAKRKGGAR